jgi:organic hydroperoxide reductase OsmC/OhrA
VGEAEGEVELEGHVLVIKRIHVRLRLRAPQEQRATAERVHGLFAESCPVYRSLRAAIAITTELAFEPA